VEGRKAANPHRPNGLPCDSVYALIADSQGDLWLYSVWARRHFGLGAATMVGHPDITVQVKTFDVFDGVQPAVRLSGPPQYLRMTVVVCKWCRAANDRSGSSTANDYLHPCTSKRIVPTERATYSRGPRFPPYADLEMTIRHQFVVPQRVAFVTKLEGRDANWQNQVHGGKLSIVTLGQGDTISGHRVQQRRGMERSRAQSWIFQSRGRLV